MFSLSHFLPPKLHKIQYYNYVSLSSKPQIEQSLVYNLFPDTLFLIDPTSTPSNLL